MSALNVLSSDEFERQISDNSKLTLIDFYADWCAPCKMLSPILEELAGDYQDRIQFAKVDADAEPELTARFGIRGLPTLLVFENGKPKAAQTGALPAGELRRFIDAQLQG